MHILRVLAALLVAVLPLSALAQIPGLPVIDFQRYFPHLTAVSEEKAVKEFPDGVQYKFLTVRDEVDKVIVLALTRKEGKDRLSRVFLARGPIEGSEDTLKRTVANFSEKIGLTFEIIDLREIRRIEDFEAKAKELGWGLQAQPK